MIEEDNSTNNESQSENDLSNVKQDSWISELYDDTNKHNSKRTVSKVTEKGGPKGKEPTRYGDWEKSGRCIDF